MNFYDIGSGDVDHDGRLEFFTGGVMSNGSWTLVYEADSNNVYSAKFLFHLLSGGLLAGAQYIATDMDGDGKLELAIKVGGDLYAFKSESDNSFALWYLRRESVMDAVTFYDFNHDGRQDIIVSRFVVNAQGRGMLYADVYLATSLVFVKESRHISRELRLGQNYPNPFNPVTTIEYSLDVRERIALRIYNLLGQVVATLVDKPESPGSHSVLWNAEGAPSGVYFCRLEIPLSSITRKVLLVR